jgi:hypothetical protein
MGFLSDHAVLIAGILAAVIVAVAALFALKRGLALKREVGARSRRLGENVSAIEASAHRAEEATSRLPDRQAELQRELEALSRHVRVLRVLADALSTALNVLRAPLRYIGR